MSSSPRPLSAVQPTSVSSPPAVLPQRSRSSLPSPLLPDETPDRERHPRRANGRQKNLLRRTRTTGCSRTWTLPWQRPSPLSPPSHPCEHRSRTRHCTCRLLRRARPTWRSTNTRSDLIRRSGRPDAPPRRRVARSTITIISATASEGDPGMTVRPSLCSVQVWYLALRPRQ